MLTRTFFARAPLAPGRFAPLPVGAVSAQGATRDRLLALRGGLLSRCASVFPEAGEQSAWFGGPLGGGMHAPELLEAMLLTGAQLGDEELRREALRLCGRVVERQREDGSFGAPGETLRVRALSAEDAMHTADTLEAGVLLYNVTGQKAILSVLMMLVSQGADYTSLFHAFPYRTPISRSFTARELLDALAHEDESGYTHHLLRSASGANLCEGLRASALCGVLTGSGKHLSAPEAGLARLNKAHGAAGGPLLGGTHPSRGVSAVSACELAASLETLLACPGGEFGADQLETLMYNTVDAAFAPDGRGVQPMQQANQAMLSRAARFPLSGDDAGLFGLEDGDALCALLSAWPRFVQSQWMVSRDDGLCAMGYAPCSVRYRLSDASVRVDVSGEYPAGGSVRITVHTDKKAAFPIHLRIPEWANGATVAADGDILPAQAGGFVTLNRDWQDGDELLLTLPMAVRKLPAFHQAVSVARGPIRFVYAPKTVSHDDVLSAGMDFAVALVGAEEIRVIERMDGSVALSARVTPLPRWGMRAASCDQPPIVLSDANIALAFDAELVPYAEAAIRLAVLPVL